ncbi:NAD-P-binding protein [Trametes elegans]|nr:NAD-P-binding protein [Trametes elegans]
MSAKKSVVLVTGCSKGGIGFALCEEFASRGCVVYATARRLEAMEGLSGHDNVHTLPLDVTSDENVRRVVNAVIEREGQLDILVNNAGIGSTGAIADVDMEEVIRAFQTNVFSIFRTAQAVIPHMASRRKGTIVNIGSIAGNIPVPWSGVYAATKAAVHSISETLYMECTPLNIDVVLIAPGGVTSNIANNQALRVQLPENSLYADYIDSILKKLRMSQTPSSMPAATFAQRVAGAILKRSPPRYMTLANMSRLYSALQWLPRGWVLRWFWEKFGEGPRRAAQRQRQP